MRIVLGTNVLVSGLLKPDGFPAIVLGLVINKKIKLLYDNRILFEYMEVLSRKKFNFEHRWVKVLINFIQKQGEFIVAVPVPESFKDNDDKKFYEVAKTAKADYIVTGNIKDFPKKNIIKTPKEFIKIITNKKTDLS